MNPIVSIILGLVGGLSNLAALYGALSLSQGWAPASPHNVSILFYEVLFGSVMLSVVSIVDNSRRKKKPVAEPSDATQQELIELLMRRAHADASVALQKAIGGAT